MTQSTASEFQFHKAIRQQIRLLIGLSGGTGSGKTFSAMRIAKGLSGDKRFCVIDTENGRASLYAPPDDQPAAKHPGTFDFDVIELHAPFTPDRYLLAIEAAEMAGFPVIVVDSASHEWAGDGGILDMQEDELYRMAKDDYSKREACKMSSWVKPKMAHKAMVTRLLQLKAHVILCFRAEPKIEMVKNDKGKTEVIAKKSLTGLDGWIPICEKNLPFELTASFLFMPDTPGLPQPIKLQEQHKPFFQKDMIVQGEKFRGYKLIDEDAGRLIGEWAKGGTPKVQTERVSQGAQSLKDGAVGSVPTPSLKPPVQETKPGVYEPKGQWTTADTVSLLQKMETAASLEALTLYAEQAKDKRILKDDKDTLRQIYAVRKKQLQQSPDLPDGGLPTSGEAAAQPPQTAEKKEEDVWI